MRRLVLFVLLVGLGWCEARAQSTNASLTGYIADRTKAVIVGAKVIVINVDTNDRYESTTNNAGSYDIVNLPPGNYRIEAEKPGFKTVVKSDMTLHVQDIAAINFEMAVGSVSEVVTVQAGGIVMNTTDGSVSTVVDRKFVENMPLNGRSFQDLILLTPGVVTNTPQQSSSNGDSGEFSVNGQRTESNYYSVDGVSSNIGTVAGYAPSVTNSGSLPASTVLGTTQGLVSIDALQEFRIQSSTYSAEYGRNPGGQFSFVTRSGANQWHGSAFDYVRNDFFDANNWFNDYFHQPEPPLRQNDFGGTLGGPLKIPQVYNGKDKSFFFFSYEGLRVIQPQPSSISSVPTSGPSGLRANAPSALQPVLNAFPLPNCPVSSSNCTNDLGNGLGDFVGTWSNPSAVDSYSVRLDHAFSQKLRLFFRFADTFSSQTTRYGGAYSDPASTTPSRLTTRTYTLGISSILSPKVSNEFHLNYSDNLSTSAIVLDSLGGAQPTDLLKLQGLAGSAGSVSPDVAVGLFFFPNPAIVQQGKNFGKQQQWNFVDTLNISLGAHQLKVGVDYRQLTPIQLRDTPLVSYIFGNKSDILANSAGFAYAVSFAPAYPYYTNFSAFAQDEWRAARGLSISAGVRWEVNPAPGAARGLLPYTVEGNSPSTWSLAPEGTALWKTTWFNFAPRLGVAWTVRNSAGFETIVRGGGGVFFDTGQQNGSAGYQGPGTSAIVTFSGVPFPLSPAQVTPVIVNPPVAPYTDQVFAFSPHLQLPFTLQWNGAIEQALGKSQKVTLSYVGANGRRLLRETEFNIPNNPTLSDVLVTSNGLTSDYSSLQVQFQRSLSRGLQVLASYTWSHSIDYGSYNGLRPYVRGNSDFDVRHNLSGALSYDLPSHFENHFAHVIATNWGTDSRFTARTGFPVTLQGNNVVDPLTGRIDAAGLDLVPGQPLYLYGPQYPGGRSINPAAFVEPSGFGNAPRNFVRGFGVWQVDLAVRREFPIHEALRLQFRAEAFNVLNHPNFGLINQYYCSPDPASPNFQPACTFGQATSTLANSLGTLSPLYQMGGPRSLQFALKLIF
jgi:hypothetical protein